jgi:integrase
LDIWFADISKIPEVPSKEQIDKLVAHAHPKYSLILSLMREMGMRPVEISSLTLRSFDLTKGTSV